MTPAEVLSRISDLWPNLLNDQQELLLRIAESFARPIDQWRFADSDIIPDDRTLGRIGDALKVHHAASSEPFKKEKLEYALERIYADLGRKASRSRSRTEKIDMTVDGQMWSLKTQADRGIRRDRLWISKMMELGDSGITWSRDPASLAKVVEFILAKINHINRIITLRCLTPEDPVFHEYELLEIPVRLFDEARRGELSVGARSIAVPPAAYCHVRDDEGVRYYFHFDGGGERKLHVKDLRKDLCIEHARWSFRDET